MSITYSSGRDAASKGIPTPTYPVINQYTEYSQVWTRNSEWPALPDISSTDQTIVGLMSINDTETNYVAIMCTVAGAATYTIDWGDGSSPVSVNSPAQGQYNYDFASVPGPVLSDGTKIVTITVTPASGGSFTSINLNRLHTGLSHATSTKWLDLAINCSTATTLNISSTTGTRNVIMSKLEQVKIYSLAASCSIAYLFDGCYVLQSIPVFNVSNLNATALSYTFSNCAALMIAPTFTLSTSPLMYYTFQNCYKLQYVPDYTFNISASNLGLYFTFTFCYNLVAAPMLKTSACTDFRGMFSGCRSLLYVPLYDTGNATGMSEMFSGCYDINVIPPFNSSKVTDFSNMFLNCRSLNKMPTLKTSNATTITGMFDSCHSLENIPDLDFNKATTGSRVFANCFSLQTVPSMNLEISGNSIDSSNMFANCNSLTSIPSLNFSSSGMVAANMFANCSSITSMPDINYAVLNNCASMFSNCASITGIPANINLSNVTNSSLMFLNNYGIQTVPDLSLPNTTNTTSMFNGCTGIVTVGNISIPKSTNMTSMFSGCTALVSVDNVAVTSNMVTASSIFATVSTLEKLPNIDYNSVTTATNILSLANSVAGGTLTNFKLSVSLSSCSLGKTNLENVFTSLGTASPTQTITISGNQGADPAVSSGLTAGQAIGSTTLTVVSSLSFVVGMAATNTVCFAPAAVTMQDTGDTVTRTSHGLSNGTRVSFATITSTTGISVNTVYYVVNATTNTFQLSLTPGGSVLPLTTNGSGTLRFEVFVTGKPSSTQVTVSAPTTALTTATVLSGRYLNTYLATLKNWTVTG